MFSNFHFLIRTACCRKRSCNEVFSCLWHLCQDVFVRVSVHNDCSDDTFLQLSLLCICKFCIFSIFLTSNIYLYSLSPNPVDSFHTIDALIERIGLSHNSIFAKMIQLLFSFIRYSFIFSTTSVNSQINIQLLMFAVIGYGNVQPFLEI